MLKHKKSRPLLVTKLDAQHDCAAKDLSRLRAGSIEFLNPENKKILAYLRRLENEEILCVANLSRFPQPVALDLTKFAGMKPIEMMGYVEFPPIGSEPYPLSLGAYDFLWFELHKPTNSFRMLAT